MATAPNNPFQDPQDDQRFGESPAPKKSGKGCLIGCTIAGLLGVFVCCGGSVFLMYAGLGVLGSEFERRLAGSPEIDEHIGEIESFEFSFSGTVEEAQKAEQPGAQTAFAYDVEGPKGSGRVLIVQEQGGDGTGVESATLVLPDGTRLPISLPGRDEADDLDMDLDQMIDPGDIDRGDDPLQPQGEEGGEDPAVGSQENQVR